MTLGSFVTAAQAALAHTRAVRARERRLAERGAVVPTWESSTDGSLCDGATSVREEEEPTTALRAEEAGGLRAGGVARVVRGDGGGG